MSYQKGRIRISPKSTNAPLEWRWTRGSGPAQQLFFEGSYGDCYDYAYSIMDIYDSIIIRPKNNGVGTWYRLEAAQNGDDVTEDFEVDGSSLTQNTMTNLNIREQFVEQGGTEADFAEVFAKIGIEVQKTRNGQQSYADCASAVSTIGGNRTVCFEFMDDLLTYGDQFLNAQYVFRKTITIAERVFVNNGGAFTDNFNNTHRIFTEAEMRTAEGIPDDFGIPPSVIDNNVSAEWLKMPTRVRHTAGHARAIVHEYLFADSWSRLKYALKS